MRDFVNDIIFREYDIRGVVDKDLYVDQIYDLTQAIAAYFKSKKKSINRIAIGMDGRTHSHTIKKEMSRALCDSGIDVVFLGVCPTPALYFALHTQKVDGGLMITASHNGKEFNGIKICLGTESIWGQQIQEIKKLFHQKATPSSEKKGIEQNHPIVPEYTNWIANHFKHLKGYPISAVVDCGNAVGGTVIPELIKKMEWHNVTVLYPEIDGTYPNHEADPTVEKNMQDVKKILQTTSTQLGIGLDGDCDRMVPMTKDGFLVPGDQLLALFAHPLAENHPGVGVVFDIKSSSGLIELLEKWGARPIMSPSGHSIIKEKMAQNNALLGGELSCHFFFKDRYFGYDDGIYALMRLIEILKISEQTLEQLLSIFPKKFSTRELRLACPEDVKTKIIPKLKVFFDKQPNSSVNSLDGIRVTMPYGWGIVRPSNTQAALSMRFESDTKEGLNNIVTLFYTALKPYLSHEAIEEIILQKEL